MKAKDVPVELIAVASEVPVGCALLERERAAIAAAVLEHVADQIIGHLQALRGEHDMCSVIDHVREITGSRA